MIPIARWRLQNSGGEGQNDSGVSPVPRQPPHSKGFARGGGSRVVNVT